MQEREIMFVEKQKKIIMFLAFLCSISFLVRTASLFFDYVTLFLTRSDLEKLLEGRGQKWEEQVELEIFLSFTLLL